MQQRPRKNKTIEPTRTAKAIIDLASKVFSPNAKADITNKVIANFQIA